MLSPVKLMRWHPKECRRERIVRLVGVLKKAPAYTQNHRAMPIQKRREGGLIFAMHEAIQEVRVRDVLGWLYGQKRLNGPADNPRSAYRPHCRLDHRAVPLRHSDGTDQQHAPRWCGAPSAPLPSVGSSVHGSH
jgi:hypothetical protein